MKIKDITNCLESFAPLSLQENYDNCGLIVGNANAEVNKALLCLDSTEEVIDEAIANGCNLVIAHHPIVFSGIKKLNGNNYIERTIIKAIKNDIAIYAIHTNLDNIKSGVNNKIAEKLGLHNLTVLAPKKDLLKKVIVFVPENNAEEIRSALFNVGVGKIGNYERCSFNTKGTGTFWGNAASNPKIGNKLQSTQVEEVKIEAIFPDYLEKSVIQALRSAHPYEEPAYDIIALENFQNEVGSGMLGELREELNALDFLAYLKEKLHVKVIRHTKLLEKKIKKVAVCGGSGSFLLNHAIQSGADCFITADFKYHQFFDAEGKIIIADIGHYESEQFTPEIIQAILSEKFPTFATLFTKINTNPINYI